MGRFLLPLVVAVGLAYGSPRGTGGRSGAVAADHFLASEAGLAALRAGGSAVDAAVAAALTAGVVQPSASGLGGGGFAIVVTGEGVAQSYDFREVAPAAATPTMFHGNDARGLMVAVPSEAFGLLELHRRHGRLPLRKVALPAIRRAEEGFATGPWLAWSLSQVPAMRGAFDEGNKRPRLALALRALVSEGEEAFRSGWVAQDIVATVQAQGGLLTLADLGAYAVKPREPLRGNYGGVGIVTMPPPSSGGTALLQMLAATEGVPDVHCHVEAAKHAMADRAQFGGDPGFVPVDPAALIARAPSIRADCGAATHPAEHYASGSPLAEDAGTEHISAMDASGMAVALTTTINTPFGSRLVTARSGIVLNDQMDDFATLPAPNAYGLVQGGQNAPQPGKRPLSSMTPTVLVGGDGKPFGAVGGSGGPFIITAVAQVVRNVLDGNLPAMEAVSSPRWHHQWIPDAVVHEAAYDVAPLVARGHAVKLIERPFAAVQLVMRREGRFEAASDPRKGGEARVRH